MQARRLSAARGAFWLVDGFRLFRRHPPLITSLTLAYLLVVQAAALLLPGIGPIILPLALPALTLIVANGCRLVDERRVPDKAALLRGLAGPQSNGLAMLKLGALLLAGAVLLVLTNLAFDDGLDPFAGIEAPADATDPAAQSAMLAALLRQLLLATPLIVAFWFAPFLVGWNGVSPAKAIFFSTVAGLRNWRAMAGFGVAVAVVAGIVPGIILIAVGQIADGALNAAFIALRVLIVFLVAPVLTASIYVSYRDIFRDD